MKTTILKSVMMMLVALFSLNANAYDVEIDGIYYNVVKKVKTAGVTSGDAEYTGKVTIPESFEYDGVTYSVTSIGSGAFYGCSGLTSITIPNSVTSIGHDAFCGCTGLTSITIPNSVTSIGEYAFRGCYRLTSVTIPNSVTSIGKFAFSDCSGLTSITIPNSVTSIGMDAFQNCSSLTSITIPNSVTSIGMNAFRGCSGLTSVTIPNSVTSIGSGAFYGCSGLTSITIPNSVTSIDSGAFEDCSSLTSVTIPNSVTSIGKNAFWGCKSLKAITIGEGLSHIGDNAFSNCPNLEKVFCDAREVPYSSSWSTNRDYPNLFKDSYIEGATLYVPSKSIDKYKAIEPWNGFKQIVAKTFDIYIDGICYNLNKEKKTAEVTSKQDMSETQRQEGTDAYCNDIVIPESIEYAGDTYSVTSIGDWAFYYCHLLSSVTIPTSITSIGMGAFADCGNLTSITIPTSVTSIGREAFSGCSGLTSVNIPESVTVIEYDVFRGCSSLTSVVIPDGVTSIWDNAWGECSALTSITIPEGVTSISDGAFYGCSSLTSVTIPSSVTNTGIDVFSGCNNLTDVYSYMLTLPITSDGAPVFALGFFDYVPLENVTLHVPESSIDVYKKTEPWSGFGKIVAINASKHMLTYMVDGKEYKTYEIETGTAITAEKEPTKEGYTFSGWSVIPATMPAKDVTVAGTFTVNKYKLIYMVDGETYKTVEVEYEATITAENEPTKEGYTFSGWGEIPATMPAKDLTVKGTFTINKYKLTYMVDGETYKTAEVEFGAPITTEDEPTKEGYTFSGWSMIPATMPAKDVTITGSFTKGQYQLTYIVDGQNYKTIRMDYGDDITAEDEPTKEGYTFSGWSEIPATMPNKDVTVTGSFIINKYTLTYKVDDEVYKTLDVDYGKSITAEKEPEKKGYTFSGWSEIPATMPAKDVTVTGSFTRNILTPSYKRNLSSQTTAVSSIIIGSFVQKSVGFNLSNNGTESINVTKLVVKNPDNNYSVVSTSTDASLLGKLDGGNSIGLSVNLNADFTPCYEWHYTYKGKDFVFCSDTNDPACNHDITYYVDDKVYVTYEPELGEEILPEAEPTKEHYTFSGWSEIPATMPNKDVTVKGSFIADKFTLTYKVDGETYKTYEVEYGADITAETEPTKEGYTFSGWSEIPATMPAKDVTITGGFTFVDAIEDVIADDGEYKIFTSDGKPVETLQKGVNIIRKSDGTTKKVYVK